LRIAEAIMKMQSSSLLTAVALCTFAVFAVSNTAARAEVVLTGSELAGLGYSTGSTCTPGCSAGYVSPDAVITTSDSVSTGGVSQFNDTATITITNSNSGAGLGSTLGALLTQGQAGQVSFNLASATNTIATGQPGGPNYFAYWDVELTHGLDTIVVNAFSDNILGTNLFDSGTCSGSSAACVSQAYLNGTTQIATFGESWTSFAGIVEDMVPLSDWTVAAVTISVGGWNSGLSHTDTIDSLSLPSQTPLPGALALVAGGLGLVGLLTTHRRRRKVSGVELSLAS
jgi:hypothetical protein